MAGEVELAAEADTYVTEAPGLHPTIVRGIHEISYDGGHVRVTTFDRKRHGLATELQINGDLVMSPEDMMAMYRLVTEFIRENTDIFRWEAWVPAAVRDRAH